MIEVQIWFVSTRIAGNDGVSLEAVRWRTILERMGHRVTFVAGELDAGGILLPELHFAWPEVLRLYGAVIEKGIIYSKIKPKILEIAGEIEKKMRRLIEGERKIDCLITANVFSLPMHFSLAVALARVIENFKIPTIARHHDFWWERDRFLGCTSMRSFFEKWFPPSLPNIAHVVINSFAREELKKRYGFDSVIIPDTFDFESKLNMFDSYSRKFRDDFGISQDDLVFLQATRIVPRKRIELSVKFVQKLNNPKAILVIAGRAGDEGKEYEFWLRELVKKMKVRAIFIGHRIAAERLTNSFGRRIYTLWDAFLNSDFVTYPTELEGFGNQFIEAVYFKKPIIMTPYPVFRRDIEPLGFKYLDMFEGSIFNKIYDKSYLKNMVDENFEIAKRNFSYRATAQKIDKLISSLNFA